jgi:hypothetical protein
VAACALRDVIAKVTAGPRRAGPQCFADLIASLQPGTVHVIASPHGMQERAVAWSIAEEFAKGPAPVLYVSMELRAEALVRRIIRERHGARNAEHTEAAELDGHPADNPPAGTEQGFANLPIAIDDRPALTVEDIADHFDRPPGLPVPGDRYAAVIIDHVLHLVPPHRGINDEERQWALAMDLRALAIQFDAVVFVLCRTRPRYTGAENYPRSTPSEDVPWQLRHEADSVWLLYREAYFNTEGNRDLVITIESRDSRPRSPPPADMSSGWPRWPDDRDIWLLDGE